MSPNPFKPRRRPGRWIAAGVGAVALAAVACSPMTAGRAVVDMTMSSAYRAPPQLPGLDALPATTPPDLARYEILAGDLHCHVSPPDSPQEATRGVAETVALARSERLDFVVLTPHVGALFFTDESDRRWVLAARETIRASLAREDTSRTVFILGMEYTDHRYGHVGAAFADLEQVFADVPTAVAIDHPERFFEAFVARGGLLVINHPLVTSLNSMFAIARADLSWRPFTAPGSFPAEILAVNRLAPALEAYNLTATHLRDRLLLGDPDHTFRATMGQLDHEIVAQQRRMIPVGGSDSHTHHLRATTFLLARGRAEADVHEALDAGRVCVRAPEACSFEARSPGAASAWTTVGGAVRGEAIEVRAAGDDIEVFVDGASVQKPASGVAVRVAIDARKCSVIRARVGEGYSAPIYANCAFAAPDAR
jgi:hypothetical protein